MKQNILYVGYRDQAHSSAGGYDKIIGNPESKCLLGENVPFGFIPVNTRGKIINVLILELISRVIRFKYRLVHYFYGDTLFIPFVRFKAHKTIATIHMNIDDNRRFKNSFIRTLRSLDGVVVLSSNQKKQLWDKYKIKSEFIPHGFKEPEFKETSVDVDDTKVNVVVLGQNYRDYEAISHAIEFCNQYRKDIVFHLIGQAVKFKEKMKLFPNAVCYPRLDDDTYFTIISKCDYNFLPVTFATANNALLEAQYLGLTCIIPNIPGITDYAAPAPLHLYYNSQKEMDDIFLQLGKCSHSSEIKEYAHNFDWPIVYDKLNTFYKSL